jgi:hypothetical protein
MQEKSRYDLMIRMFIEYNLITHDICCGDDVWKKPLGLINYSVLKIDLTHVIN